VLGQQPLNDKTWADYVAGLDKLGAKDLEASAKKTLQTSRLLEVKQSGKFHQKPLENDGSQGVERQKKS